MYVQGRYFTPSLFHKEFHMSQQLKFRLEVTKYEPNFKGVKLTCRHFTIVGEEFGPSAGEVLGYCGQEFADFLNANFPHPDPVDHSGDDFNSHLKKV
jgi:hypothetical protein